jgi:hypothetical protein
MQPNGTPISPRAAATILSRTFHAIFLSANIRHPSESWDLRRLGSKAWDASLRWHDNHESILLQGS